MYIHVIVARENLKKKKKKKKKIASTSEGRIIYGLTALRPYALRNFFFFFFFSFFSFSKYYPCTYM